MSETVTAGMVDEVLVQNIWQALNFQDINGGTRMIRAVLAYLCNNPIDIRELDWDTLPILCYVSSSSSWSKEEAEQRKQENYREGIAKFLEGWQRIAYLKKEPEYPEELKELFAEDLIGRTVPLSISRDQYNRDLVAAWKIGKDSQ